LQEDLDRLDSTGMQEKAENVRKAVTISAGLEINAEKTDSLRPSARK